jgi:hypothetical protein
VRISSADVRLAGADESLVHDVEALDPVGRPQALERLDLRHFFLGRSDDKLSAAIVGDAVARAELVEAPGPLDAQLRFQRSLRIVDPGMDDAAVVRTRLHPGARTPFEDHDGASRGGERTSGSEAGDSGADYGNVQRML